MDPKKLLEHEIIANLLDKREYFSNTIHYLESDHFSNLAEKEIFKKIKQYYIEFKKIPSMKELVLSFKDSSKQIKQEVKPKIKEISDSIIENRTNPVSADMLLKMTEKHIKLSKFALAVIKGADALGENNEDKMTESFALAEDAVKVSLNEDLGVSLNDIDKVFAEFEEKPGIKLNIPSFDTMIGSGYTSKTLHAIMAASGVGKSAAMAAFAVQFMLQGKDVIIVSLEMSEAEMFKRIYSNIYDINIETLTQIDKSVIKTKYESIKQNIGQLVVKEFPTGGLTPLGLDSFLTKIANDKGIHSPVVFVDYLGIMASDKMTSLDNSYAYFGSIAEELRAVAQKRDLVMFTALQLNRSAINNLEADQSALAESMKILMVLDSAFIIAQTPQMKEEGKMKINFVKNRMSGKTWSFDISFNYKKFRFIDKFNVAGENVTAAQNDFQETLGNLMNI